MSLQKTINGEELSVVGSKTTLGEIYGPQFEAALVKLMLGDERFASYAGAHLTEDMFLKAHYKEIASAFSHIFKASGSKPPSQTSVEAELNMRRAQLNGNGGSRTLRIEKALSRIGELRKKKLTLADEEHIKRNLQGYILNRRTLRVLNESLDLVESQEFDKIPMLMSEAIQSSKLFAESDAGFNYTNIDNRLAAYAKKDKHILRSPLGIPRIDKMLRGGLEPGKLGVIVAPPGCGKCLGIDTPVMLYNGTIIPVQDVVAGDLLMGPDSKPRTVLSTTRGTGPLFKVIPVKGDPWVCNDAHILTLVPSHGGDPIDIPLMEYLRLSAWKKIELKQFSVPVDFPEKNWIPIIDPYFLGVWFGDGTKGLNDVSVSKPDAEIFSLMQDMAKQWGLQVTVTKKRENECPTMRLSKGKYGNSNPLLDALRSLVGDGTKLPAEYLTASKEVRSSLLAGLLDTDGFLGSGCFEIVQKQRGVANDICFLARSLGMRATIRDKYVTIRPGDVRLYHRVILSGDFTSLPIRISRKIPKKRKQVKNVLRTGITVEAIGEGDYAGFTLDGDGRFLLGDFTVTHNTLALITAGAKAMVSGMNVVHITLEIDQAETSIRYDAHILGLPINELLRNYDIHKKKIKASAAKNKGKLIIREWGPSEVSATDIRAYLRYLENVHKFHPDVIIIDYADLLKSMRLRTSEITEIADTYRSLRQIAKDMQCRLWTASQVNKEGFNQDLLSLKDIYGTGEKAAVPDVILGLCQNPLERRNGYMRIVNLKNRQGGREGSIIDCDINTGTQTLKESAIQRSKFKKNEEED